MGIEVFDFEDDEDIGVDQAEAMVNVTAKVAESARDMFSKIAHRKRMNVSNLGGLVIEEWVENYIKEYKKKQEEKAES